MWQAVVNRDADCDCAFVYAVRSTRVYCRPSCPSRKPARRQVAFFPLPEVAEQAGFRPCKRCHPRDVTTANPQTELAQVVCRHIADHLDGDLTLTALGHVFNISPQHLQRTFKQTVGVSPQAYVETCRMARFRAALQNGDDISGSAYDLGFGSISRIYSKSDAHLGMTPRTYRNGGAGMRITYITTSCPLGQLLVAATERGVCAVQLGDADADLERHLASEFGRAILTRDDVAVKTSVEAILVYLEGRNPHLDLPLDIQATAFQRQVWGALQSIPYGETRTYSEVAAMIGRPTAVRAVAHAWAQNPVALVVPCHRVVRKDGDLGGYRWGLDRKADLLRREAVE